MVDYPGVGYSEGKLPPARIGQASDFVLAFADAMKLDKFILLGWSWGGYGGATVVPVEHPGRVTHAILDKARRRPANARWIFTNRRSSNVRASR